MARTDVEVSLIFDSFTSISLYYSRLRYSSSEITGSDTMSKDVSIAASRLSGFDYMFLIAKFNKDACSVGTPCFLAWSNQGCLPKFSLGENGNLNFCSLITNTISSLVKTERRVVSGLSSEGFLTYLELLICSNYYLKDSA